MNYIDNFTKPPKSIAIIDLKVLVNIFKNNVSEIA